MRESNSVPFANKAQHVARLLLDRVIEEGMKPGSSFGTEADLLEQLDVSRPTLRESLRILESQGIVTLRPGPKGGILVSKPSIDALAGSLSVFLQLHNVPFGETVKARMSIEPALVGDAALHGTNELFDAMEQSIDRMAAAKDDDAMIYQENREFHNLIAQAANNPILEVFWRTIRILADQNDVHGFALRNRRYLVDMHREVLEACRNRDPAAARRLWIAKLRKRDEERKKNEAAAGGVKKRPSRAEA
ncbi:FCD domain-containing protein [Sphingobium sp.]|uniref:FadR/GntR family transcriptional regulator n=1 Tax=Sphingobium sp. TaxID=1912891 RepID=UPI00261A12F7|nr:FCD domain-containing protein [Sphingobium sp.]